jgi:S-adenosylhomocysteine hydrolase
MELEFLQLDQEIPQHMPILDRWVRGQRSSRPLEGVSALFIQHQFGNQVPQARAMLELGLEPEHLFWLDVPYTSNASVREALVDLGIPRRNMISAHDYQVLDPYAPYQRRRVQSIIHSVLSDPPERLLVLDDGAYFLEAASCFVKRLPDVVVVEQTARGLIKMASSAAMRLYAQSIPVVNVARSIPKKTLEPPFIGRAVCAALLRNLHDRFSTHHRGRCLILGFGAIGSQVATFVSKYLGFPHDLIHVFDPEPLRIREAHDRGYSLWEREDLNTRFQLVIGCSGHSSLTVHDYVYLEDGAILASASSGSVELSREEFIELADSSEIDDIEIMRQGLNEANIHSDLRFQLVDREATFLNAGFPVNFDGRVNCVPSRFMQPTATMMVAASVQAISCTAKGLVELDPSFCAWLDREFRHELGDEAFRLLPHLYPRAQGGTPS